MPVSNIEPDTTTGLTHNVWTVTGGTKATAVRLPDNDDTSFLRSDGSGAANQDLKTTEWPTDAGGVNSIQVTARVRRETAVGKSCFIGVENGSGTTLVNVTFLVQGSYTTTGTGVLARPGGGSWTAADLSVNVTWMHAFASPNDGRGGRLTTWYIVLDYTQSGYSLLEFYHWLLPVVGSVVELATFREILAYGGLHGKPFNRKPITRFHEEEILPAWRDFKEYAHPRRFFLGAQEPLIASP